MKKNPRLVLWLSLTVIAGCSSTRKSVEPFQSFGQFNPEKEKVTEKNSIIQMTQGFGYRLAQTESKTGSKRNWLVDPDGNPVYPVGLNSFPYSTLGIMESYAKDRLPFIRGVIYSLEPDYGFFIEKEWWKTAPIVNSKEIGVQLDAHLPFPTDALDQTLQLDAKDPSYIFVVKWLYRERSTPSLLGITDLEREKFRERLMTEYYSKAVPAVRRKYPGRLIVSQPYTVEEMDDRVIREVSSRFCDLILIRYPQEKIFKPEEMKEFMNRFKRPVFFLDVPVFQNLNVVVPLLSNPKVVGWQWNQEQPLSESDISYLTRLERDIPKVIHFIDTAGIPSNY